MKRTTLLKTLFLSAVISSSTNLFSSEQEPIRMELRVDKKGTAISPTMYGLFFEDINFAADGGLYAEMIKNRSFDFKHPFTGWNVFGDVVLMNDENSPFINNPNYIRLNPSGHRHKHTGVENEGFFGIAVKKGESYKFSFWGKTAEREKPSKVRIEIVNSENNPFVKHSIDIDSDQWHKYEWTFDSKRTFADCTLRVFLESDNGADLEHISMFPAHTYKWREGGLREDLATALDDINPGVFRFPGGCIVEGTDLATRYDWKKSLGPVENRQVNENRWNYTFSHRMYPDYFQTYGLGYYEYFLLSEDMGAEPLPILNCGLSCQYQNKSEEAHVCLDSLQSYIQDALDLIEFANGDSASMWGSVRAEMGHPEPFNLKYIGIGNEQWGQEYVDRLKLFIDAIRAKYPDIKIVGGSGPKAEGEEFDYLWPEMKKLNVDLVDEHYYQSPEWFLSNAKRYDNYDRKGPKVFAGEYACHVPDRANSLYSALCEAAFMTGLERNADIVTMATYAPLFAHIKGWQWRPDMIWFDNLTSVKSANYYVQQLYSQNKGTNLLSLKSGKESVAGQDSVYASAVYDKDEDVYIIKVVNPYPEVKPVNITVKGLKKGTNMKDDGSLLLTAKQPDIQNSIRIPDRVLPKGITIEPNGNEIEYEMMPYSFVVMRLKEEKK